VLLHIDFLADIIDFITDPIVIAFQWIWIVPLIFGWYSISTPSSRRSIPNSLERASRDLVVPQDHPRSAPLTKRERTTAKFLLWTVAGDEEKPGAIFNYARCFTWRCVVHHVVDFHRRELQEHNEFNFIPLENAGVPQDWPTDPWFYLDAEKQALTAMAQAFGLSCLLYAILMTLAFVICYQTPTRGLGCCSLPVIAIFGFSLLSASLLLASSCFSKTCSVYLARGRRTNSIGYCLTAGLGAATYTLGKTLAYLNAIILFGHSVVSIVGVYNNCYCDSNRISLGDGAYMVFLSGAQIRSALRGVYGGCLAGLVVTFVSFGGFIYYLNSGR